MIIVDLNTFSKNEDQSIKLLFEHQDVKEFVGKFCLLKNKNLPEIDFQNILKTLFNEVIKKTEGSICIFGIIIIWNIFESEKGNKKLRIRLGIEI